jgi:hypothetical protein
MAPAVPLMGETPEPVDQVKFRSLCLQPRTDSRRAYPDLPEEVEDPT